MPRIGRACTLLSATEPNAAPSGDATLNSITYEPLPSLMNVSISPFTPSRASRIALRNVFGCSVIILRRSAIAFSCDFTDASRLLMFSCAVLSSVSFASRAAARSAAFFSAAAAFCSIVLSWFFISSITVSLLGVISFSSAGVSLSAISSAFISVITARGFAALVTGDTSMMVIASSTRILSLYPSTFS